MSLTMKVSRAQYSGDPGLFGFLGKIGKTVTGLAKNLPGPIGAIAGVANRIIPGSRAVPAPPAFPGTGPRPRGINLPAFGPRGAGIQTPIGRASIGETAGPGCNGSGVKIACPTGYHPNKSDYFLRDGTFIPAGSKCVRNRRRNPLNPRAADRAIGRIESAKKAAGRLSRITIRKKS